jgi:antitoxin (DNA-binding transcriptional repressor) of toxin-antitoxin stability system
MHEIPLKDAEATLSALVDDVLRDETFAITRHGRKEAILISWAARLSKDSSFGACWRHRRFDIPERDCTPGREIDL